MSWERGYTIDEEFAPQSCDEPPTTTVSRGEAMTSPQPEGQAPVTGYRKISDELIALVNENKSLENEVGEQWNRLKERGDIDPRMLAHARTQLQDGFMWLNRAIFQPESEL